MGFEATCNQCGGDVFNHIFCLGCYDKLEDDNRVLLNKLEKSDDKLAVLENLTLTLEEENIKLVKEAKRAKNT